MKNITEFSTKALNELGYYVYLYSDPDTKEPFYVGKGQRNRVFDHLNIINNADPTSKNEKLLTKIKELHDKEKQPHIEILVHGIDKADEATALKIEATIIDLIGIDNLCNQRRGHGSSTYGKIEVSQLDARYRSNSLKREDITEKSILIRINKEFRYDMSALELYEVTRAYWKVNIERAKSVQIAFAIYEGMVMEVYEIAEWFPASTTFIATRENFNDLKGRYEFVGKVAGENIREKYISKSVKNLFPIGNQNPITYLDEL